MVEMLKRLSFSKNKRLINNKQFKTVLANSKRFDNGLLTLYMAKNSCGYSRLGISVGKSCGGAVARNQLKRLLREVFRQSQNRIPAGFDYLLMISPQWLKKVNQSQSKASPGFERIMASFLSLVDAASDKIG